MTIRGGRHAPPSAASRASTRGHAGTGRVEGRVCVCVCSCVLCVCRVCAVCVQCVPCQGGAWVARPRARGGEARSRDPNVDSRGVLMKRVEGSLGPRAGGGGGERALETVTWRSPSGDRIWRSPSGCTGAGMARPEGPEARRHLGGVSKSAAGAGGLTALAWLLHMADVGGRDACGVLRGD